jgi:hypothetical protein
MCSYDKIREASAVEAEERKRVRHNSKVMSVSAIDCVFVGIVF